MAENMQELTSENFEQEVLNSAKPVIVDFWAPWCMPCKMITPIVGEIKEEYEGRCNVVKVNIDDAMEVATKFRVMNIPTVVFFKDGREVARVVGVVSKDDIVEKVEELLA